MKVVPCEYRKAHFAHSNFDGYWVKLWLLIEPSGKVHSFLHQSELVDNSLLASEAGVKCFVTYKEVLCCEDSISEVYKLIKEFEC